MAIALTKRFVRLAGYVLVLIGCVAIVVTTLRSPNSNVQSILSSTLGIKHEGEVVIDLRFKECWKSKACIADSKWNTDLGMALESDQWQILPKDLYLNRRWLSKLTLFYRTVAASEIPGEAETVLDVAIENPVEDAKIAGNKQGYPVAMLKSLNAKSETLTVPSPKDVENAGWRRSDYGLWVKYGNYIDHSSLSGVNVLFGRDCKDPRPGWTLVPQSLAIDGKATGGKDMSFPASREDDHEVYLSIKRGKTEKPHSVNLKYKQDGSFKIVQIADLHYATGYGKCRDTFPALTPKDPECLADVRTSLFVEKVLELEKPDLVVLTGDQVFGDEAPDAETAMLKVLEPFIRNKIPYALIFGNHDDEGSLSRKQLMDLAITLPYCVATPGPEDVSGVGNYVITVAPPNGNKAHAAAALYFLDTHKYSLQPKTNPGYDWLKEDQLKFVENEYSRLKPMRDAYTYKHLSMGFIHIPLPEYRDVNNGDKARPIVGEIKEGVTAPNYNTGMADVFGKIGVSVVTAGHDHCNDYCMLHPTKENEMWFCYGGAAGEGGYSGHGGTTRRIRVFELKSQSAEIGTWKRLETDPETKFDVQKNMVYMGAPNIET